MRVIKSDGKVNCFGSCAKIPAGELSLKIGDYVVFCKKH